MYRKVFNGEVNHRKDVAGRLGKSKVEHEEKEAKNRNYTLLEGHLF